MFVKIVGTLMHLIATVTEVVLQLPVVGRFVDVVLSFIATSLRFGAGGWVPSGLPELKNDPIRNSGATVDHPLFALTFYLLGWEWQHSSFSFCSLSAFAFGFWVLVLPFTIRNFIWVRFVEFRHDTHCFLLFPCERMLYRICNCNCNGAIT